jgi:hypothetical protein
MATELTVILEDRPGTLARVATVLGDAGVNIERTLGAAGYTCERREVVVVRVLDEPGTLAQVALTMATAGINIEAIYVTTRGSLVLSVDDVHGAMQVAAGLDVVTFDG